MKKIGFCTYSMKPGTPAGRQLERAVSATLPANTSSFAFFMRSFAQGFRFGLLRSAIRKVGCCPELFCTNGWAGLNVTGFGPLDGGMKSLRNAIQPAWFAEKSGVDAFCASASVTGPAQKRPASRELAIGFAKGDVDIVAAPFGMDGRAQVPQQSTAF